jgi:hypothetical protein
LGRMCEGRGHAVWGMSGANRLLCRLGLWLVGRCCAPAVPFNLRRARMPELPEEARRRMLRRIARRLRGVKAEVRNPKSE